MANLIGLHHVAFAEGPGGSTHRLLHELLGMEPVHVEEGDGFIERMIPAGSSHIQTLEEDGPGVIQRFLRRRGPALHHIALEVDDIEGVLKNLRDNDVPLIDSEPRPGGMGTTIAFIHPSAFGGLLVELVERPSADPSDAA